MLRPQLGILVAPLYTQPVWPPTFLPQHVAMASLGSGSVSKVVPALGGLSGRWQARKAVLCLCQVDISYFTF